MGKATRRIDSRRKESVSSRREEDEATRSVDSRRRESVSPRREENEATRRVDSRRRESVSPRREEDEAIRRVDTRRKEHVSSRRKEAVPSRREEEDATRRVDTRREVVESELGTWTIRRAIQNKKQQPETNLFNEKETDGAVKERSETKIVLKLIEKTQENLSCWNMFGLKSLKEIIPGTIQELFIEQAIPMVVTLGLIQRTQRKAAY